MAAPKTHPGGGERPMEASGTARPAADAMVARGTMAAMSGTGGECVPPISSRWAPSVFPKSTCGAWVQIQRGARGRRFHAYKMTFEQAIEASTIDGKEAPIEGKKAEEFREKEALQPWEKLGLGGPKLGLNGLGGPTGQGGPCWPRQLEGPTYCPQLREHRSTVYPPSLRRDWTPLSATAAVV
ncbi:hypothetical protein ACLOJK_038781 [Asimina triloba]